MRAHAAVLLAFAFTLSALGVQAQPDDPRRHQRVDGFDIYLGVVPSELVRHHERQLGGKDWRDPHNYHVLVALFDAQGRRVTKGEIKARVSPLGVVGLEKSLEPMPWHDGELTSYGNFFKMPDPGLYRIELRFRPAGVKRFSQARFVYERPAD